MTLTFYEVFQRSMRFIDMHLTSGRNLKRVSGIEFHQLKHR